MSWLAVQVESEPTLWPFQKLANQATHDCGCLDSCRCHEGIKPRLTKSAIYHTVRKIGKWQAADPARVAFSRRLQTMNVPRGKADELSLWLSEDALFWSEGEAWFDLTILDAEIDGMLAFGKEREYPAEPGKEEVTATLAEVVQAFPKEAFGGRRPTTVMHFYKRLGLWPLTQKFLEPFDPDRGEIENHSTSSAWRCLGHLLSDYSTLAEIRHAIRDRVSAGRSD